MYTFIYMNMYIMIFLCYNVCIYVVFRAFLCLFAYESEEGLGMQIITLIAAEKTKLNLIRNNGNDNGNEDPRELDFEVQSASEALLASLQSIRDGYPQVCVDPVLSNRYTNFWNPHIL